MTGGLIMVVVLGLLFFGLLGWFAWSSWSQRFSRTRVQVLVRLVECIAVLIVARQLIAWGAVPVLWFVAIGVLAVGVAGLAARWSSLPWTAPTGRRRSVVSDAFRTAIAVAVVGLVLS